MHVSSAFEWLTMQMITMTVILSQQRNNLAFIRSQSKAKKILRGWDFWGVPGFISKVPHQAWGSSSFPVQGRYGGSEIQLSPASPSETQNALGLSRPCLQLRSSRTPVPRPDSCLTAHPLLHLPLLFTRLFHSPGVTLAMAERARQTVQVPVPPLTGCVTRSASLSLCGSPGLHLWNGAILSTSWALECLGGITEQVMYMPGSPPRGGSHFCKWSFQSPFPCPPRLCVD